MTDADTEVPTPEVDQPTETPQEQVETFDREYVEKLRRENATYRTKAKQAAEEAEAARKAAEREKLDEVERLKAEKADAEKAAAEARAEATRTRHLVNLAGKVAGDPEDALLLAERAGLVTEDGVDVDALLKAKPFLAPKSESGVNIPGARSKPGAPTLTEEDIKKMTPQQVNERYEEIQAFYRSKR